ncbi:ATP phosphoribosyltransferase regulatory subunit [Umezawaea sp. Da 62-37]|uniref:ATP phosphoribosyltransferase regulatory subunit n=1 Tax=Umezawaea sp. Da 62-37 TaxID=3075927 RepID=UPI0028F73909|nr:ATP phosphoribosyltransferase regulatory subunit [Umezawaea sp. Da 62-37]WNV86601.1 ATP phosphoribosyltransferase regulatory subunit [Umezawaea sp. Da 62-37]
MADLFGLDLRKRQFVTASLAKVVRLHGYEQVEVPLVERATSFSEDIVGRSPWPEWDVRGCFYMLVPDYSASYNSEPTDTEALLVPEGTISVTRWLGRQLAENPDMTFPVKLFYDMPCFRNEVVSDLTGLKRRQFTQFGLEVLGAEPGNSDIEAIYLIARCLEELGVPKNSTRVRVGDVGVFNRLIKLSQLDADAAIQVKEALDALAECKAGKLPERAPGLVDQLTHVLDTGGVEPTLRAVWLKLAGTSDSINAVKVLQDSVIQEHLDRLLPLSEVLRDLGIWVEIDLSVVRSHEYYTGIAFEIDVIAADTVFVEVGGGGRYDKLVKHFVPGGPFDSIPATGFAFGVERLVELLDHLDLLHKAEELYTSIRLNVAPAEILMTPGLTPEGYLSAVRVAAGDRTTGRPVDIYLGKPDVVEQYAAARKIPQTVSCEP